MSKIAFEMRDQMDSMTDAEFENAMSLSKTAFLEYLDQAAAGEKRCQANVGEPAPGFSAYVLVRRRRCRHMEIRPKTLY